MRFLRSLYDPTCRITDSASITKIPPMKGKSNSCLIITATVPIAPPKAREPTSPMNTSAGCALYQRNPMDDPTIAPQKIVSSPTWGMRCSSRYPANTACPLTYVSTESAPAAITVQPIASPSSPSVRLTALLEPTITSTTNTMKGTNASGQTCGELSQDPITRSGRNCLTKGTISLVEYSPLACIAIRRIAMSMLVRI